PEGDIVPSPFPMAWPLHMHTTVEFSEEGEGTRVTLTWQPVDATEEQWVSFRQMLESMLGGWTGSFDQLDGFLAHAG
ncbi:MAG: SRPBCC domain-containing protein, partial [Novosphingobium sp.]|nr:SRPBCC domain-containing protein [Novosphingobium sp.]